jgi:hypothetical protein
MNPRGARRLFFLLLAIFAMGAFRFASSLRMDYYDAFVYLTQANRVVDARFQEIPYDHGNRPRALVMLLALSDRLALMFQPQGLSLVGAHYLMVILAIAYLLIWRSVGCRLWNDRVGNGIGILLLIYPFFIHYAVFVLADVLSGLLWGALAYAFLTLDRRRLSAAVLFGVLGALATTSKHSLLPAFPVLLAALYVNRRTSHGWLAVSAGTWWFCLELILRAFGDWHAGVVAVLIHAVKLGAHISRTQESSAWVYVISNFKVWGVPFIALAAIAGLRYSCDKKIPAPFERRVLCGLNLALFVGLQFIPHREVRYGLPFVPLILGSVVSGGTALCTGAGQKLSRGGIALWILACLIPAVRSINEWRYLLRDPVLNAAPDHDVWMYLSSATSGCSRVVACYFERNPADSPNTAPGDQFFNRYNVGDQVAFFSRRPSTVYDCRYDRWASSPGTCEVTTDWEYESTNAKWVEVTTPEGRRRFNFDYGIKQTPLAAAAH